MEQYERLIASNTRFNGKVRQVPSQPASSLRGALRDGRPDPEVVEKAKRRKFSAQYKLWLLREADACASGEVGALLRREGLYSSNLTTWRRQREQGELDALSPRRRGRKTKPIDATSKRNAELERKNQQLQRRLEQAEAIIEVQSVDAPQLDINSRLKVAALLGNPIENDGNS